MWCWATGSEDDALLAEREYGRECAREFTSEFPGRTSAKQEEIVTAVGARLAAVVKDARRQFRFGSLPAPTANAFALPGGFVFITAPLIDLCAGDRDQMAFYLAHEMGHVLRGHAREQLTAGAFLKAVTARLPGAGALLHQVLNKGYSRQLEFDADREALRLAQLAGFDPRASIRAMQSLSHVSPDTAGFAEYFASHPPFADRIRELEKLAGA